MKELQGKPKTAKEAKNAIKSLFRNVYFHECIAGYYLHRAVITDCILDQLVAILCDFPQIAADIQIACLNGDSHLHPLVVLVHAGGTIEQVKKVCEEAPNILQSPRYLDKFGRSAYILCEVFSCCSKPKPSILLYLIQKCPDLLSCIEKECERRQFLENIVALRWDVDAVSCKEELEDLHNVISAFFDVFPGCCGGSVFQRALIQSPSYQRWKFRTKGTPVEGLLDITIDKMVENFPLEETIYFNHCYACNLVITQKASSVLERILPRAKILNLTESSITYETIEAFVTMMQSIQRTVKSSSQWGAETWSSTTKQLLLQEVRLQLPSKMMSDSKLAVNALSPILLTGNLTYLSLNFSSGDTNLNETCDDNAALEVFGKALQRRTSAGLETLSLNRFCVTNLEGLSSILTSPWGPTKISLSGYITVTKPGRQFYNFLKPHSVPRLQDLYLHACKLKQEKALVSVLELISQLGTIKRLTILGQEKTCSEKVTGQILRLVKNNKQMTHLSIECFKEAAFPYLCSILADSYHCLQSLHIVLDGRTAKEIKDGVYSSDNVDDNSNDDSFEANESPEEEEDEEQSFQRLENDSNDDNEEFLESALAHAVRNFNVNLTECRISRSYKSTRAKNNLPVSLDLCKETEYYFHLNASGRMQARGQCKATLIEALNAIINENNPSHVAAGWERHPVFGSGGFDYSARDIQESSATEVDTSSKISRKLQLLYGLLRELPALWAG